MRAVRPGWTAATDARAARRIAGCTAPENIERLAGEVSRASLVWRHARERAVNVFTQAVCGLRAIQRGPRLNQKAQAFDCDVSATQTRHERCMSTTCCIGAQLARLRHLASPPHGHPPPRQAPCGIVKQQARAARILSRRRVRQQNVLPPVTAPTGPRIRRKTARTLAASRTRLPAAESSGRIVG